MSIEDHRVYFTVQQIENYADAVMIDFEDDTIAEVLNELALRFHARCEQLQEARDAGS